jgi:hypothetical protein
MDSQHKLPVKKILFYLMNRQMMNLKDLENFIMMKLNEFLRICHVYQKNNLKIKNRLQLS